MKVIFDYWAGDDIEIEVEGSYEKPDRSVAYIGSFWVEAIRLKGSNVNILSLFSDKDIEKLEWKGMDAAEQQARDAKAEASEMRRQAAKDNQMTGE